MTAALSPLATEFARVIAASAGKRVPVPDLLDHAGRFNPGLIGDPMGRSRVLEALDELRQAGAISFPSTGTRTAWDTRVRPPLPAWVTRVEPTREARRVPVSRVWPSALEAAAEIATRPDELELLARIAEWLRDNPEPERVPVEERSLELFDKEKALDGYLKTRLFNTGALSLDLLACHPVPLPFVSRHVNGVGPTKLLVVENLATYHSIWTVLNEHSCGVRPDAHIGWGHGEAFTQSVLSMTTLEPEPERVVYFGDLDLAGLRIAAASSVMATRSGLPPLRAAESCYRYLLDGPASWRRPDKSNSQHHPDYDEACQWIPESLREPVCGLLNARQRIPQERLGLEALRRSPELLLRSM
jgi:Uncharacterized protein conserved in bacteria C-term(DUF2220)